MRTPKGHCPCDARQKELTFNWLKLQTQTDSCPVWCSHLIIHQNPQISSAFKFSSFTRKNESELECVCDWIGGCSNDLVCLFSDSGVSKSVHRNRPPCSHVWFADQGRFYISVALPSFVSSSASPFSGF